MITPHIIKKTLKVTEPGLAAQHDSGTFHFTKSGQEVLYLTFHCLLHSDYRLHARRDAEAIERQGGGGLPGGWRGKHKLGMSFI